eukprot:CAMPEP_0181216514 /NCGR_PEP_ID=MMETSP1096-20121128/26633_1 /TAXON_ID=156174 ORGANISM="Chrysochromulina ericina, Strain CCMP281" /NCGR_SAMPLE_ID=MMETSP1096 /ASSEMBLY_ACC=CAM_ASM_000453 /LENGTH=64 /DNA_ID=CAMNT_0023308533 /DNA_START=701 /DNA_END=895 /DNA_ORIENTATION=+
MTISSNWFVTSKAQRAELPTSHEWRVGMLRAADAIAPAPGFPTRVDRRLPYASSEFDSACQGWR